MVDINIIIREFPLMGIQGITSPSTYDGFNHLIRLANGNAWTTLVTQFLACSVSSIHRNDLQANYLAHGLIAKHGLEL